MGASAKNTTQGNELPNYSNTMTPASDPSDRLPLAIQVLCYIVTLQLSESIIMLQSLRRSFWALSVVSAGAASASAADLNVVVTSKPVHSLAAAVMEGVGKPVLLIEGSASPHTFSL